MAKNKGGIYVYQQIEKTLAEWLAEIKPIPARVLCWESDTGIIRMGDGVSLYKDLSPRLSSGLSPRINEETENWEIFNISIKEWEDTGIRALPPSAPRVSQETGCWEVWNDTERIYEDTGIHALPPSAPRVSQLTGCWEVWDDIEWAYKDTGIKPVLAPNIDGGSPSSVYTAPQIFDFGKINE